MNNEDAVKTLKSWIECMATTNCDYDCEHCHLQIDLNAVSEACAVVITELSQIDDDTVSRKAVLDAIMGEPTDAHYPSWYAERIKVLPPSPTVQPDPDTVSRKAAMENVCTMLRNCFDASDEMIESVKITVGELPPSPSRPKGQWIYKDDLKQYFCSECGYPSLTYDDMYIYGMDLPNFCEECGADMRGTEHE